MTSAWPERIAVVLPGGMGSTLYDEAQGRAIWEEDFLANYRRFAEHPEQLAWADRPARAELIESARILFFRTHIWRRFFRKFIDPGAYFEPSATIRYAYDWRRCVLENGVHFAETLGERLRAGPSSLSSGATSPPASWASTLAALTAKWNSRRLMKKPRPSGYPKLALFTHSMGGMVARSAVGQKRIHPSWIDRIIQIGAPVLGSPVIFHAAYEELKLPGFRTFLLLRYWKNKERYEQAVLRAFRTFPSTYQMMPPKSIDYASTVNDPNKFNPLYDDCIPKPHRKRAHRAHQVFHSARQILIDHGVPVYSVYTSEHRRRNKRTEIDFTVTRRESGGCRYTIDEARATRYGDSIVPASSAKQAETDAKAVSSVDHELLCDDKRVVDELPGLV